MTLQEAAERLGLHYMTVYRYVRTGRLSAAKDGTEWRVKRRDVERLLTTAPSSVGRGRRSASYDARIEGPLVVGDRAGAWAVVEAAMAAGLEPADVYREVFVPTLRSIGDGWADGRYTVAQEHLASTAVMGMIGQLSPRFNRRGRKRGSVAIGASPADEHSLPVAMARDLLRGSGFRVHSLGANVPVESFVETALGAERLVAVAICATTADNESAITEAVSAVHDAVDVPVFLGGGAVPDLAIAADLGADARAETAEQLVQSLVELAAEGTLPDAVRTTR